jgi:Protein of unknown function (DUF3025)
MQPWLSTFNAHLCNAVLAAVQQGEGCLATLNTHAKNCNVHNAQGLPLRFVPQAQLPAGMAYEQFIYDTGGVPTRTLAGSNGAMHDTCNALMWLHYPRTKGTLNALQAAAIRSDGVQATRGALRDALTLFDESALILCCPTGDAAPVQLAQRQWHTLLLERRAEWHTVLKPLLFGHAVLQKLQAPYPAITAQVWVLQGVKGIRGNDIASNVSSVDAALAASIQSAFDAGTLKPQALLPLPVLGIPKWWAGNRDAAFYDNTLVFRPLPTAAARR